jgi:hypothetical protein
MAPAEDLVDTPVGEPDRKVATQDKMVTIVTTSGNLVGDINLNFSSVQVNRVSDLLSKGGVSFLPLYHMVSREGARRNVLVNIRDVAVIIPHDKIHPPSPELRKDRVVSVKLKFDLGTLSGKTNLMGETQEMDRISDLLNFPGKKWLVLYEATFKEEALPAAIINIEFISTVED